MDKELEKLIGRLRSETESFDLIIEASAGWGLQVYVYILHSDSIGEGMIENGSIKSICGSGTREMCNILHDIFDYMYETYGFEMNSITTDRFEREYDHWKRLDEHYNTRINILKGKGEL